MTRPAQRLQVAHIEERFSSYQELPLLPAQFNEHYGGYVMVCYLSEARATRPLALI